MRKTTILLLTIFFLAIPVLALATQGQPTATDARTSQVAATGQVHGGAGMTHVMNTDPTGKSGFLLAKRDGRHHSRGRHHFRGHNKFKGHHKFGGHHRFKGHHGFKRHHGFKGHHKFKRHHGFKHHHFRRNKHHFGFGFLPFFKDSYCYNYSPFYGYYKLPYSYCYYR